MGCCWIKPKKHHNHKSAVEEEDPSRAGSSPPGAPADVEDILNAPSASTGSGPSGDCIWAPSTSSMAPLSAGPRSPARSPAHSPAGPAQLSSLSSPHLPSLFSSQATLCADSEDGPPTRPSSPADESSPTLDESFPEIQTASPPAPLSSLSSPSPPPTPREASADLQVSVSPAASKESSPSPSPSPGLPEATSAAPPVLLSTTPLAVSSAGTQDVCGKRSSKATHPERLYVVRKSQVNPEGPKNAEIHIPAKDSSVDRRHSSVSLERHDAAQGAPRLKATTLTTIRNLFRGNKAKPDLIGSGGEGRLIPKLLGLPNIGNTCFMNATLQCLYTLPGFCLDILRQEHLWPKNKDTGLMRLLAGLYRARLGQDTSQNKRKLLLCVKRSLLLFNPEYSRSYEQDAHEFLTHLLTKLQMEGEAMRASAASYRCPVEHFEFKLLCIRTCSSCGEKVYSEEQHTNLSLDLCFSVKQSLELYCKAADLECTCCNCSGQKATVTRRFLTLPSVLVLHMKRFHYNAGEMEKLEHSVNVLPFLSLSSITLEEDDLSRKHERYTADSPKANAPGSRENGPANSDQPLSPVKDQKGCPGSRDRQTQGASVPTAQHPNMYRLSGVVSHLGDSLYTGHYVSDVARPHSGGWLTVNDAQVSETDEATVLKAGKAAAYILFYALRQEERHAFRARLKAFSPLIL